MKYHIIILYSRCDEFFLQPNFIDCDDIDAAEMSFSTLKP